MAEGTAPSTISGPPGRPAALPSLTGLRWFAAMLVFLSHASLLSSPYRPDAQISFFADHHIAKGLSDVFASGYVGVSFFFVLSGFVLTWSTTPGERVTAFWRRRALKIYPNHIVVFAVAMWLFASSVTPTHAWLPNLFLVHTWSNRPEVISSVNLPAWSLCVEVAAYALFPLFLLLVRRIPESRLWLWAGGMVAGVVGVPVVTQLFVSGGMQVPGYHLSMNQLWFSYGFPPMRLFEFGLGMVLARIVAAGLWPRIGLVASAVAFGAGYWLTSALPYPYRFYAGTIIPFAMIICSAAAKDLRGERGWLASRPVVWLGNVSFAFYLCQGVVVFWGRTRVLDARTYGVLPAVGLTIALMLANLLAAWLLYRLVELPVMRRWSRSSKRPAQLAPRKPESVPVGEAA